jgi:hypothetical protein
MKSKEPSPPRWAETMLRSLLRPSDRESISGDLLEEYRAARYPALGALRANAWYFKHALSVLWYLIRPYALVLAVQSILLALTVFRPGHHAANFRPEINHTILTLMTIQSLLYGSIAPTPGVSLFDALVYFLAAYHGVHRTRLVRAGMLAAGGTCFIGFTVLFAAAAIITPGLVVAPFVNPFIFVVLSAYLLIPMGYAVLLGALAGVVGRWVVPVVGKLRVC